MTENCPNYPSLTPTEAEERTETQAKAISLVTFSGRSESKGQLAPRLLCHQMNALWQDSRHCDCTSMYSPRQALGSSHPLGAAWSLVTLSGTKAPQGHRLRCTAGR